MMMMMMMMHLVVAVTIGCCSSYRTRPLDTNAQPCLLLRVTAVCMYSKIPIQFVLANKEGTFCHPYIFRSIPLKTCPLVVTSSILHRVSIISTYLHPVSSFLDVTLELSSTFPLMPALSSLASLSQIFFSGSYTVADSNKGNINYFHSPIYYR
ncbi:hypothetical protein F4778DRAFT_100908 [Xylariomycetidae sp. FL2044]|nr:hypothetical protein F4778DRAFT_100908 [Xylariomycetidae sp. FL2044]